MIHDVVIIGAGPAGSYAAYCLAVRGYDVAVLEEDPLVGTPTYCSGLIGVDAFAKYDLPTDVIIRSFTAARFYSPYGAAALVSSDRPIAYVVDRGAFDRSLARKAQATGASYRLATKCIGISPADNGITVEIRSLQGEGRIKARVGIVATGVKYNLLNRLGIARPERLIEAAQTEIKMRDVKEVEVYLGRNISPGSFGWAIPLNNEVVRLGICNRGKSTEYLQRLLENSLVAPRLLEQNPTIRGKPIPISPVTRTYLERILIVGDAAGQVKPTTGGGIHYSILCAEIAATTLDEAFRSGDFSNRQMIKYESRWRKKIGTELQVGSFFRRLGRRLSDRQIDFLIRSYQNLEFQDLVKRTADFERHSGFIVALCRSQLFWDSFWTGMKSKILRI